LPGRYQERLHIKRGGTAGNPVIFRAAQPGTVVITGEAKHDTVRAWVWQKEGDGIFSTLCPWAIYWMVVDGKFLFGCFHSMDEFRTLVERDTSWGAFFNSQGRLYISLPGKNHPEQHDIRVHKPVVSMGVWHSQRASNAWIEDDHIDISGMTFEFGVGSGINVWDAVDVSISECMFSGCSVGIDAVSGIQSSDNLTVERCFYHNFPQGQWNRDWLTWKDIYASYGINTLIRCSGENVSIHNNLILHGGDGIQVRSDAGDNEHGAYIFDNFIAKCTDDALEVEGNGCHITISHNVIYDCMVSLGLSPVFKGPVIIDNNYFLHPESRVNYGMVKFGKHRWVDKQLISTKNTTIASNVFVGNWLCWYSDSVENIKIEDNIFAAQNMKDQPWPEGTIEEGNHYIDLSGSRYPDPINGIDWLRTFVDTQAKADEISIAVKSDQLYNMRRSHGFPGPRWLNPEWLDVTKEFVDVGFLRAEQR